MKLVVAQYLHRRRHDLKFPKSDATLNLVIKVGIKNFCSTGAELASFSVHDLRRTASSLLKKLELTAIIFKMYFAYEKTDF